MFIGIPKQLRDHAYRNMDATLMQDAADEIELLRKIVVEYGDRSRMANAEFSEIQQAIDRAFESNPAPPRDAG